MESEREEKRFEAMYGLYVPIYVVMYVQEKCIYVSFFFYCNEIFNCHLFSVLLSCDRLCLYTKSVHSILFLHGLID